MRLPTRPPYEQCWRTDEMPELPLRVKRIDAGLPLPEYAHDGDAGMDLRSSVTITLAPFERALVPCGIAIELPEGYAGFVQPRSGLAIKQGLSLVNTPGLIDSHYRGEIQVIAINVDPSEPLTIERGGKVAQLVIQRVERVSLVEVDDLGSTVRGESGFGSTGA